VQASEYCKPVERPNLLSVIGMSNNVTSPTGGSNSVGPPVNSAQLEIGGPSRLSKRRDDAGRPGFFSKLLGKNRPQAGVNDEAFDRSASPLLGFALLLTTPPPL
jgi:hypothetical protein